MGDVCHVLECGTELALPMPGDWSSDEGDCDAEAATADSSTAVAGAMQRLLSNPQHTDMSRSVADCQSAAAAQLKQVGAQPPAPAHVADTVSYTDATHAGFKQRYFGGVGRPCVVTGVLEAEKWPAAERWSSVAAFVERYGTVPVQVTEMASLLGGRPYRVELPVSAFVDYARSNTADWPYYSWERNWDEPRDEILRDFSAPAPFSEDLYDLTEETRDFLPLTCHLFVLLGGERSGSNMHKDPKWTSAWNTVLCGRKRWVMFPPDTPASAIGAAGSDYRSAGPPVYWWLDVYPRLAEQGAALGMVDIVQGPGDTVFIPSGWWHATLNLPGDDGVTICCTRNCLLPESLPVVWPQLKAASPDFARRFARTIRSQCGPHVTQLLPADADEVTRDRPAVLGTADWGIRRVPCTELSLRAMREHYIRAGKPAIITGLGEHVASKECRSLSREWLRSTLGMKMVSVRAVAGDGSETAELMSVDDFCRRLDSGERLYLYDCSLPLQLPSLTAEIAVPRYFAHSRLQRTRRRHCFDRSWPTLFIGASGTSSRLHVDQWHGHFWMTVLSGSKRWRIWHPEDAHLLSPRVESGRLHPTFPNVSELEGTEGYARARSVEFVLHEGETLFVPGGAPHVVYNDEDSTAVAGNFIDDSNFAAAMEDLRRMAGTAQGGGAIADVVKALDEIDFGQPEPEHDVLLPPAHLVVPYGDFRSGAAADWPPEPPM